MIKKNSVLLIGVVIIVFIMGFVVINKRMLADESFKDGQSILKFDVLDNNNEIEVDSIKQIILKNTELGESEVKIEKDEKSLIIRFKSVELEVINRIRNSVIEKYKHRLKISSYQRIDRSLKSGVFSIIDIYPLALLISVILFFLIIAFILFKLLEKTLKKVLDNKELNRRIIKLEKEVEKLKSKQ